jgi:hypothetical protein
VTGTDTGATICVEWGGAKGYIGGAYPAGVKGTQSWTLVSGMFVVPADATSVTIDVYVRKGMIGTVRHPFLFFLFSIRLPFAETCPVKFSFFVCSY